MSKKMWNKIFKSKSQKAQPLAKINKRHSRGIYEEYQQLNDLLAGEKAQLNFSPNEKENEHGNGCGNEIRNGNGNGNGNGTINVFEQPPHQSSFNSLQLSEAHQLQQQQRQQQSQVQQQQLSTFSRVRNTFSLKRSKKSQPNAKSSESDMPSSVGAAESATATASASATVTAATLTNNCHGNQLQRVVIVVNKIDVATNRPTNNNLHATSTATTDTATAIKSTINATSMDPDTVDNIRGSDEDPIVEPPPQPLTSGLSVPVPEHAPTDSTDLTPCPCCSRTFNLNALRKHITICEKSSKKRKVFDSSRQRRDGTSLSTYVLPKNFGLPNAERTAGVQVSVTTSREAAVAEVSPVSSPVPTRRKSQSEMVRSTARASLRKAASTLSNSSAAESVSSGTGTAPAPVPAPAPAPAPAAGPAAVVPSRDRSLAKRIKGPPCDRCPHCDRSFNPKAFDRHVEWCKEKALQATIKAGNSQETSKAKERLEARKQYKPPNLKTKRSLARDKYSGTHEDLLGAGEMSTPKPNMMSLSMTSSVHSDNNQVVVRSRNSKADRSSTQVTQNQVSLYEDQPSSPPPRERARLRSRRKPSNACGEIDEAMDRLRRNAGGDSRQVASLDCVEAPVLQPARARKVGLKAPMTFDDLNGVIKRKGGGPIYNVQMDEPEIATLSKASRSATSLVRQARRRISTREHPMNELCAQDRNQILSKNVEFASLDSSMLPMQRIPRGIYSGSDDDSPRAEFQIKMQATTMRTVCRSKKREGQAGQERPALSSPKPMRALPMPQLKQSLEVINQSMGQVSLPRLQLGNRGVDHDSDQDVNEPDDDISDIDYEEEEEKHASMIVMEEPPSEDDEDVEEDKPAVKFPPLVHQGSNVNVRRLVLLEQDENGTMYIKSAPKAKLRLKSGLGGKYDPFLSAKRQLEELCSPSTPPPEEEVVTPIKPKTPTATPLTDTPTAAPSIAMTTSLTTSGSKPAQIAAKVTPASNFRRTSSLRGPRRTPLLPSRPLFATNYRPTIQRGLSDEGPISTNFLKPEEYDEMPVRAACGNDFHSPRVVRRDTSASNRKQMMKLPVGGTFATADDPSSAQPCRNVSKTDSLAVFLKYEHELEQLNAKAAEKATATVTPTQLTSKDLKDKSNNLSKQNSAKSLGQSTPTGTTQLPPLTPLTTPQSPAIIKENNSYPPICTPLRLEPIHKPVTPLTPIKLESIFGPRRETGLGPAAGLVASDYIDPKLINACDNLHLSSGVSSDASSTPQPISQSRSRSSSQSTITHERRQSGEARNLLKRKMRLGRNQFLYDASPEDADASSGCSADDEANRSSMEFDEQCWQQQQKQLLANPLPLVMPMAHTNSAMPTFDDFDFEEFLSSFENENDDEQFPLFKDCREFLLNRSTSRQRSFQKATSTLQTTATQPHQHNQSNNNKTKDAHAHRSDSNVSAKTDESSQSEGKQSRLSELEVQSRLAELEKQNRISEMETRSRLSELEKRAAAEDQQKLEGQLQQQKREIFISIETEANAQGRSPISPESLRHMVGNSQTPIDVLHIENGNEPEHARFSKISDTEDAGEEPGDRSSQLSANRLGPSAGSSALAANVQFNNAKNLIQQFQSGFRQMGEEVGAEVRRTLIENTGRCEQQMQLSREPDPANQPMKAISPLTPSPSADSDELSSLDSYPVSSSHSSRRGAASKMSTDSAYGSSNSPYSLSRQRSGELPLSPRSQGLMRPHTASAKLPGSMADASTQAQTQYGTLKARQRLFGNGGGGGGGGGGSDGGNNGNDSCESSSSGSENEQQKQQEQLQQHASNYNYQQQQTQPAQPSYNNNNVTPMTPTTSQHSLLSNNSNSSMSSSMKMSKFCHECGARFIVDHAKFCMDCGVRRIVVE
ncbi:hypothetical protein KR018_009485 [Drosophila ironensis]|nr:hypothetical protein KR018_009485 [Drosophila ironensis]